MQLAAKEFARLAQLPTSDGQNIGKGIRSRDLPRITELEVPLPSTRPSARYHT